jgi:hypothetical protein
MLQTTSAYAMARVQIIIDLLCLRLGPGYNSFFLHTQGASRQHAIIANSIEEIRAKPISATPRRASATTANVRDRVGLKTIREVERV